METIPKSIAQMDYRWPHPLGFTVRACAPLLADHFLGPRKVKRHTLCNCGVHPMEPYLKRYKELFEKRERICKEYTDTMYENRSFEPCRMYGLSRNLRCTKQFIVSYCGCCNYLLWQWGKRDDSDCECGAVETIKHLVQECPLRGFSGSLRGIHEKNTSPFTSKTQVNHLSWIFFFSSILLLGLIALVRWRSLEHVPVPLKPAKAIVYCDLE